MYAVQCAFGSLHFVVSTVQGCATPTPSLPILVTGGESRGARLASGEILGGQCAVPPLPQPRAYHVTFTTADGQSLLLDKHYWGIVHVYFTVM